MFRRTLVLLKEAAQASTSASPTDVLIGHLQRSSLETTLARSQQPHKNLYQLLSTLPRDGVGMRVRQRRWEAKGLDIPQDQDLKKHVETLKESDENPKKSQGHLCYWEVTKVKLKDGGNHGKAWGKLVWRGKPVTDPSKPERIRGSLKYFWDRAL